MSREPARDNATCPRCTRKFECRPHDVSSCACAAVPLDADALRRISERYEGCLCPDCLLRLKAEDEGSAGSD